MVKQSAVVFLLSFIFFLPCSYGQIQLTKEIQEDSLIIPDLNLKIKIPDGWHNFPVDDYHLLAALTSKQTDSALEASVFTLQVSPLNIWASLDAMQRTNAERKALKTGQKGLFSLGNPEQVTVLNENGTENLYFFSDTNSVDGYLYALVTVEKNGLAFMASYWGPRGKGSQFDRFREWIKNDIEIIDLSRKVSSDLIKKMEENDAVLFGLKQ